MERHSLKGDIEARSEECGSPGNPDFDELSDSQGGHSSMEDVLELDRKAPTARVLSKDSEILAGDSKQLGEAETARFPAQGMPKSYLESPGSQVYDLLASIKRSHSPSKSDPGHGAMPSPSTKSRDYVSRSLVKIPRKQVEAETYYQRCVHLVVDTRVSNGDIEVNHLSLTMQKSLWLYTHGVSTVRNIFSRYFVKQHINEVPDYKFSQPRSKDPQSALKQARWSFDEAHPALAADHYLRNQEQNKLLEDERWKNAMQKRNAMLNRERERAAKLHRGLKVRASCCLHF